MGSRDTATRSVSGDKTARRNDSYTVKGHCAIAGDIDGASIGGLVQRKRSPRRAATFAPESGELNDTGRLRVVSTLNLRENCAERTVESTTPNLLYPGAQLTGLRESTSFQPCLETRIGAPRNSISSNTKRNIRQADRPGCSYGQRVCRQRVQQRQGVFYRQIKRRRRTELDDMIKEQRAALHASKNDETIQGSGLDVDSQDLLEYTQRVFAASSIASQAALRRVNELRSWPAKRIKALAQTSNNTVPSSRPSLDNDDKLVRRVLDTTYPATTTLAKGHKSSSTYSKFYSCNDISERIRSTLYYPPDVRLPLYEHLAAESSLLDSKVAKLRLVPERSSGSVPCLSTSMKEKAVGILAGTVSCMSDKSKTDVDYNSIRTLNDRQWLNDEIVNAYIELLVKRSEASAGLPSVHGFNTFFYSTLRDAGYQKIRRWTKRVDIFTKDLVIIPVHLGMHWCCAVINFREKRLEYYDSLHGGDQGCLELLREYLRLESLDKRKEEFDTSTWVDYVPRNIPRQANGYDCGVFTCMFAECVSRAQPFDFGQQHMKHLRLVMVYEIGSHMLIAR